MWPCGDKSGRTDLCQFCTFVMKNGGKPVGKPVDKPVAAVPE